MTLARLAYIFIFSRAIHIFPSFPHRHAALGEGAQRRLGVRLHTGGGRVVTVTVLPGQSLGSHRGAAPGSLSGTAAPGAGLPWPEPHEAAALRLPSVTSPGLGPDADTMRLGLGRHGPVPVASFVTPEPRVPSQVSTNQKRWTRSTLKAKHVGRQREEFNFKFFALA